MLLGLNLGLGRGEALGLRWCDIEFEKRIITVNKNLVISLNGHKLTEPKSEGSNRSLLKSELLCNELLEHKKTQLD